MIKCVILFIMLFPILAKAEVFIDFVGNKVIIDKDSSHQEILLTEDDMKLSSDEIVKIICHKYVNCKDLR